MKKEQLDEVLSLKDIFMHKYQSWREGQALFNAIWCIDPVLGDIIRATEIDPFHRDDKIDACMEFLRGENETTTK